MLKQAADWNEAQFNLIRTTLGLNLPIVIYEGGQTFVDYSGTDTALQKLFATANRDPRMGTAYTTF